MTPVKSLQSSALVLDELWDVASSQGFVQTRTSFLTEPFIFFCCFFFTFCSLHLPSIRPDYGGRGQPRRAGAALPHQTLSVRQPGLRRAAVQHHAGPSAEPGRPRGPAAAVRGPQESAGQPHLHPLQDQGERWRRQRARASSGNPADAKPAFLLFPTAGDHRGVALPPSLALPPTRPPRATLDSVRPTHAAATKVSA